MPSQQRKELQTVLAYPPVNHPYPWVSNMMVMICWAIFFSVVVIIGSGLIIGFASTLVAQSEDYPFYYYSVTAYKAGFIVGIVLICIAGIASFVIGIVILIRSWSFIFVRVHGLIIALGVVTLLGGLGVVTIILGLMLLMGIADYKEPPLKKGGLPEEPSRPSPPPPPLVVPTV